MAVITISRQYGSRGEDIATRVCDRLGYRYFDKTLMTELATEAGLSETEIVDFSEDHYKARGLLDRFLARWGEPRVVTRVGTWTVDTTGARVEQVAQLDETQSIAFTQSILHAAYQLGNVVIVGRGGQALLSDAAGVLHVRVEAPVEARLRWLQDKQGLSSAAAQEMVTERDRATRDYLKRFYDVDWADPAQYHLVLNTGRWDIDAAAQLIVNALSYLPTIQDSAEAEPT